MKTKRNTNNRARFNAVDAGILLIVLAILLVSVYFIFFSDKIPFQSWNGDKDECTVIYTLEIRGVDHDLLDESGHLPIVKGESLYHIDDSYALGEIASIGSKTPYQAPTSFKDEKGNLMYVVHPDKSSFTVTVEATATLVDGAYQVDGNVLRVGDTFTMATPYFTAEAYCKEIKEVTANE